MNDIIIKHFYVLTNSDNCILYNIITFIIYFKYSIINDNYFNNYILIVYLFFAFLPTI